MKIILRSFLALALSLVSLQGLVAQDTAVQDTLKKESPWKFNGMFGLNASQTAMSNWAAGGNNNFAGNAFVNLVLNYKKGIVVWTTTLDTDYGKMFQANQTYNWKKTGDKLNFLSNLGFEFSPAWQVAAQFSYKSQFDKGYEYKVDKGVEQEIYISDFTSPAYLDFSVGINYKPNEKYSLYLSPVAGRSVIVSQEDLRLRYGVPIEDRSKTTLGASFTAACNLSITESVKLISSLGLYTPYNDNFGNIDLDWDLAISYRFLKVFNVSLNTSMKYYDGVLFDNGKGGKGPRLQFKEVLGIGLGYNF